jgi:hypothetical protein
MSYHPLDSSACMQYKQLLNFLKTNNSSGDNSILENDMKVHCTGEKYDQFNAKYGYYEKKKKDKLISQFHIIETDNNHCAFYKAHFNIINENEGGYLTWSHVMNDIIRNCK